MVIHGAFWAFGGIFASVFVMSKLLATETSQRVGDEWGNFNFQKAYIDFGRNCTPMESEITKKCGQKFFVEVLSSSDR